METAKEVLGILAGVLFIIGFVPYGIAIIKKQTRPEKATWVIWLAVDTLTLIGMLMAGTLNGQIVGVVLGASIILILALIYGEKGWKKFDIFCLAGAAIGMVLSLIFKNPLLAIIASSTACTIGSFPTFKSAWQDPSREDKLAWTIFWVSCVCAVLAIPHLTAADMIQPLDFFVIESAMMLILLFRKPKQSITREK